MVKNLSIVEDLYLRQRLNPAPGDPLYLHLADLRAALEAFRLDHPQRVLDFGSGGSPYHSLFPGAPYHRADFEGTPGVDYVFDNNSVLPIGERNYDLILSTQVLEHVLHPERYLAECFRLLLPGGRLLLTTHGIFEDHGCPCDYRRWTADGLKLLLEESGFQVRRLQKLTCGARALFFLLRQFDRSFYVVDRSFASLFLRVVRRLFQVRPAGVDRFCDRTYSDQRAIDASQSGATVYIALLCEAVRPAG